MALVYVADDEPDLAAMLKEMLEDAGHACVTANDGAALLARVAEKRPDLVLLDINMPGLSGWDVKKQLDGALPVIAVTAQGGASIETSAIRTLRFAGFVRKPFRMAELLASVDHALAHGTAA
jgi:DNA-binding response OmpR family regulator